ncbi:PilN domain-containing protein [Marinobacter fonticola]|uniref:PilN domain-containing protein n=1 Tax=Marinobacter fonticola TaxID=2603215 RepID=UPI0011E730F9|nr:PilN domain-containing protein [Marinobacter fonticola]
MIQQINLYTDELRPKREPLQARSAGVLLVALVAVLILAGGFARWEYSTAVEEQRTLQQQVNALQDELAVLETTVAAKVEDPDLVAAMRQMDREAQQRRQVLSQVETLVVIDGPRFSAYLEALARQTLDGLWLTTIDLGRSSSDLRLTGVTRAGERVPQYLQRLSAEPAFIGREFHSFALDRAEDRQLIQFSVATDDGEEGGHGS